jgi:hypothetical protein
MMCIASRIAAGEKLVCGITGTYWPSFLTGRSDQTTSAEKADTIGNGSPSGCVARTELGQVIHLQLAEK